MGSYVVIGPPERIEDPLLEVEIGRRWFGGLGFERLVHAFMSTVLLRATWRDALVRDPELQPPDVEPVEAVNPCRGKGRGARMPPSSSAAPRLGPAMALQDVEDRAARGPGPFRELCAQALQDLPR